MKNRLKREFKEFGVLLRSVPSAVTALFISAVLIMNLLANKSIDLGVDWLALDCGIIVSWFCFLAMDMITKHFGAKAATEVSLLAIAFNLAFSLIAFAASRIPGVWGESYGQSAAEIGKALDNTLGGTWYVVLGSTAAFLASAVINNFTNAAFGLLFKRNPDGAAAFFFRSYVSTAIGQFCDNLIFALIVGHNFFNWSLLQCITCAATGMLAELFFEVAFSFIGYAMCKRWKRQGVGREYFELVKSYKEAQNEGCDNGNE